MNSTNRIVALCGMAWFVMIIDACFTWFLPDNVRIFIGFLFVILGTIILIPTHGIRVLKHVKWLVLSVFLLMAYFVVVKSGIYNFCKYFPLLLISLWSSSVLMKMYSYFRKFVIFYAILSIAVEVLFISGLWKMLPRLMTFPPQDFVQVARGTINYFYGLFCIPFDNGTTILYRACGPLREGGHWIFFLGFTYFVEKTLYNKRNIWLIICGLLTLSPNFVVFFGGTEAYCLIKQRNIKPFLYIVGFIILLSLAYPLLPDYIKNEVTRIILERTLENSLSNLDYEGYMAILDGRAGDTINDYYVFEHSDLKTRLWGLGKFKVAMSDYRWMLLYGGYIGSIIVLWCIFNFSIGMERNSFGVILLFFALTIFVQRAWMFYQVYIWALMHLIVNEKSVLDRRGKYARLVKKKDC